MNEVVETSIFEQGNVKITNLRAMIGTKTYAMSNITSVSMEKQEPSSAPKLVVLIGIMLVVVGVSSLQEYATWLVLGVLLIVAGISTARASKPTYTVQIGSASGETNILESKDAGHIKKIVEAMNEAIVRRG